MALTLDNTLASLTANSYVDVEYADAYWADHYSPSKAAQWSGLPDAAKAVVLIHACRVIETARFTVQALVAPVNKDYCAVYDRRKRVVLFANSELTPTRYYYYQTLQFPRNLDVDAGTGDLYIPEPVQLAQCEQALYLLNFDEGVASNVLQGVTDDMLIAGDIRIQQSFRTGGTSFAPMALEFLRPFLLKAGTSVRRG